MGMHFAKFMYNTQRRFRKKGMGEKKQRSKEKGELKNRQTRITLGRDRQILEPEKGELAHHSVSSCATDSHPMGKASSQ